MPPKAALELIRCCGAASDPKRTSETIHYWPSNFKNLGYAWFKKIINPPQGGHGERQVIE